jgi:hypothetical protein
MHKQEKLFILQSPSIDKSVWACYRTVALVFALQLVPYPIFVCMHSSLNPTSRQVKRSRLRQKEQILYCTGISL